MRDGGSGAPGVPSAERRAPSAEQAELRLTRLPFLPDGLRARIATVSGYPEVSRTGESSVPGLYFVGAPTAVSIGPSARFIAGTHTISAKLARAVARRPKATPA